ncbi:uncharacterized protein (DUF2141 family) [Spirosoma oryzae]|uniref:Uncharacterized protein (DUF2141 family) n=1 Tax=Spirosoma oryzae TaxID=1469603 RepID=A0A2T0SGR3_9BACT|nr:DUF2141 domain-containing protein [Spirosoma oryzae]PRY32553.1 uncharacterized protein (DUF2141 family) [Spirosoma oryzae]
MKSILFTLVLLVAVLTQSFARTTAAPADSATHKLTVTVTGIVQRSGKFYVGLATDDKTFSGKSAVTQTIDVPATGDAVVTFSDLKPGKYAVRIFQDMNDNKTMDFSGQMPAEPFGFSNVTMLMGPPTFDQCAFTLDGNKAVQVSMMEL